MGGFEIAEFSHQGIELGIAHRGIVEDVIAVGVLPDRLA
jgi:hypothetical protein